jgi:hypothetical protein
MRKFLWLLYPFVNTTKKRLFGRPKAQQGNEDQENVSSVRLHTESSFEKRERSLARTIQPNGA